MSGVYVDKLKDRARAFLKEAISAEDPDLAVFFAEQSIQLYIKAVHYELFGEMLRGLRLRELLAVLVKMLEKSGFNDVANSVLDFVDRYRRMLILAEEAYTMSRYGEISYSIEEARNVVEVAKKLIELLDEVVKVVKLG